MTGDVSSHALNLGLWPCEHQLWHTCFPMLNFLVKEQYFCCWGIPPQKWRNTQVCRHPWLKSNDKSQKVCKSLQIFISKLYTCHGNWFVIPLFSSISTQWWVLNKEVEWMREIRERGREKDHQSLLQCRSS